MLRFWLLLSTAGLTAGLMHHAVETEMFAIPISPNLFNWTFQEFDQQYRFHAALQGKPELPSWLRYLYSARHHAGFIFGTPPRVANQPIMNQPIMLEVVGLNRQDFETRRLVISLYVHQKTQPALHEVEFKIDNLNVEDLLDIHRMNQLRSIFRHKLWTDSADDLYATFLASAIDMGARHPLKPEDGEGVVVRLGSTAPFSKELLNLREEVRPLSKLPSCPREFKRTTVERLFRDAEFKLDWCHFELYKTVYTDNAALLIEYLTEIPKQNKMENQVKPAEFHVWAAPAKKAIPTRSYLELLTVIIAVPLAIFAFAVTSLTFSMCFHYAIIAQRSGRVELCRYPPTGNTDQTCAGDGNSAKSQGVSPDSSLVRPYSPKSITNIAGNFNRPQPPPYMGSATNTLHNRKSGNTDNTTPSTSGHTPEHKPSVLEESLKLLSEANILNYEGVIKRAVFDIVDGTEDFGHIKSNPAGYISMKGNLDDIDVPDLGYVGAI